MPSSARPRTRTLFRLPLFALAVLTFSACMNMEAVIRVMPDGSGTVERNLVITNDFLLGFVEEMGGAEENFDLCGSPDELAAMAERMGEGVRLESSESGEQSCNVVFAFDDINDLAFDLNPEAMMPGELAELGEGGMPGADAGDETPLRFEFDRGDPATLVVHLDQLWDQMGGDEDAEHEHDEDEEGEEHHEGEEGEEHDPDEHADDEGSPLDEMDAMERAMMKMMLEDSRFSLVIELGGTIVDSDASFVEGNRIILIDMDLEQIVANDEDLELFMASEPDSPAELRALMDEVEGIRIETNETTTIRFRR